jgi:hypothetical protein
MNRDISTMLRARNAVLHVSRMNLYDKACRYELCKSIRDTKRPYILKLELNACGKDLQTTKENPTVWCPPNPPSQMSLTHFMLASRQTISSH